MADIKFDIKADGSGVLAELRKLRTGVDGMTKDIRGAGDIASDAFAKVGAVLTVGAVVNFVDAIAQAADDLADIAENVNTSTVALQGLRLAAGDASSSAAALDGALGTLQKNIGQAAQGTGRAREAFALLGLEADELANLGTDEALYRVADALGQLGTEAERAGIAEKLLGDGAKSLRPLLEAGGDALRSNVEAYADTAYVLDSETVTALAAANREFEKLGILTRNLAAEMSVGFVSVVSAAAGALAELNAETEKASGASERWGATAAIGLYAVTTAYDRAAAAIYNVAAATSGLLALPLVGEARAGLQELAAEYERAADQAARSVVTFDEFADRTAQKFVDAMAKVELASENFGAFGDEFRGELSADTLAFIDALDAQTEAALAPMRAAVAEAERIAKYLAATQGRQFGQGVNAQGLVSQDDPFNPLTNTDDPFGADPGLAADVQARLEADVTSAIQEQLAIRLDAYSQFSDAVLQLTGRRIEDELALEQIKAQSFGEIGGGIIAAFAANNEKAAKIAQSLALAQTVWHTGRAIMEAAPNYALMAKVAAAGVLQIARIKATKYSGSVVSGGSSYAAGAAGGAGSEANARVAENAQEQRTVEVFVKGSLTDGAGRVIADLVRKEVRDRNVVIIDSDSRQARELVGG